MWGGANDISTVCERAGRTARHRLFRMMMGNAEHVPIVNAAVHAYAREVAYWSDIDRLTREAEVADTRVVMGDKNQGEGTRSTSAHVGPPRAAARMGREFGVAS